MEGEIKTSRRRARIYWPVHDGGELSMTTDEAEEREGEEETAYVRRGRMQFAVHSKSRATARPVILLSREYISAAASLLLLLLLLRLAVVVPGDPAGAKVEIARPPFSLPSSPLPAGILPASTPVTQWHPPINHTY